MERALVRLIRYNVIYRASFLVVFIYKYYHTLTQLLRKNTRQTLIRLTKRNQHRR